MWIKLRTVPLAVQAGLILLGCAGDDLRESQVEAQALAAADLPVVRVNAPGRSSTQVADKMAALATAFGKTASGRDLAVKRTDLPMLGNVRHARHETEVAGAPGVFARYETENDAFEVYDVGSMGETAPSASDIDANAARKVFSANLEKLYAGGLVSRDAVTGSELVTREVHCTEGDDKGVKRDWIDEYLIFAPTTIGGTRVGTTSRDYGVTMNVHKSGRVRRIEITGAAITASEPNTVAVVRSVKHVQRANSNEALAKGKFGADALVKSAGLRYIADELASGELVPRDVLKVHPAGRGPKGEQVYGKAYTVSLAVDDASDNLDISPKPGDTGARPWDNSTK